MNKEILKSLKKLFLSNIATTIIGIITVPIVFKYLSPQEYGVFTLIISLNAVLSMSNQLISSNTILPLITNCIETRDIKKEYGILRFYFLFGLLLFIFSSLIVYNIAFFVYKIDFILLITFLGYLLFNQINTYLINISLMYKDYNFIAIATVSRNLYRLVFILIFIFIGIFESAFHNLLGYFFSELIVFLIMSLKKIKSIAIKFQNIEKVKIYNLISLKLLFKNNTFNFFGGNILEGKNLLIIWIINTFMSTELVGVYGAVTKIVSQIWSFYKNFESSIFPYISTMIEKGEKNLSVKKLNYVSTLFSLVLTIFLVCFNEYVIKILLSSEYLPYQHIFALGYIVIFVSSFQLSQKSIIYSLQLTDIIFWGAIVEFFIFLISFLVLNFWFFGLSSVMIGDILGKYISIIFKKRKLRKYNFE